MTNMPKLEEYPIEVLVNLGDNSRDQESKEYIKGLIVDKILSLGKPVFYLLNKFRNSKGILKESYAKTILIKLQTEEYIFDEKVIEEILSLISLDDLVLVGANVISDSIRNRCKELFWVNAELIEDTSELNKKNKMYRRRVLVEKMKGC